MSDYRTANVYVGDTQAGILMETEEGYSFTYNEIYLRSHSAGAVSLTMPLRAEPYISKVLFPFFDGLIPEGWLLHVISENWKIDTRDRFGLLLVSCRDCIGNVSIRGDSE